MRFIIAGITLMMGLLVGPLFLKWAPPVLFPAYTRDTPHASSLEHVVEASQSIRDVSFAVLCLFIPVHLASPGPLVPSYLHGPPSLPDFLLHNRVFYDRLVHEALLTDSIHDISSLSRAVDLALSIDDWVLLHEDGQLALRGIGDVHSYVSFATEMAYLSRALPRLQEHIELSIARSTLMQRVILFGLSVLDRFYPPTYLSRDGTSARLARVVQLCVDATSDSARRVDQEIQGVVSQVLRLRSAVETLVREDDESRLCAIVDHQTCARLAPLYRGRAILSHALSYLQDIQAVVNEAMGGLSEESELPLYHKVGILVRLVDNYRRAMQDQLLLVAKVRKVMIADAGRQKV